MDLIDIIKNQAKELLVLMKCIKPMVFFADKGKVSQIIPLMEIAEHLPESMKSDKSIKISDVALMASGLMAKSLDFDEVIVVHDAAMKQVDSLDDNDITKTPATYPKSMRLEAIIVFNVKFPSKDTELRVVPYKGGDGDDVTFVEEEININKADFSSHLVEKIIFGYEKLKRKEG